MTERESTHDFLPIIGSRVLVSGTRRNGFWGTVIPSRPGMSCRGVLVQLDEWDEPAVFYNHQLWTELALAMPRVVYQ